MRPSVFGACQPDEDVAMMVAYSETLSDMKAHENYEQERKSALSM